MKREVSILLALCLIMGGCSNTTDKQTGKTDVTPVTSTQIAEREVGKTPIEEEPIKEETVKEKPVHEHNIIYIANGYTENGFTHTAVCDNDASICDYVNEIAECAFNEEYVCTACGYEHIHNFVVTDTDKGTHTYICSECGYGSIEDCAIDDTYFCEVCGADYRYEIIPVEKKIMYPTKKITMRALPNSDSDSKGTVKMNEEVTVIGQVKSYMGKKCNFYQLENGYFVLGKYLSTEKTVAKSKEESASKTYMDLSGLPNPTGMDLSKFKIPSGKVTVTVFDKWADVPFGTPYDKYPTYDLTFDSVNECLLSFGFVTVEEIIANGSIPSYAPNEIQLDLTPASYRKEGLTSNLKEIDLCASSFLGRKWFIAIHDITEGNSIFYILFFK